MLTYSEMKNQVADRINKTSADYLLKIGDWINYRYDDILGRFDWPCLYRTSTQTLSAGDSSFVLPRDCGLIMSIQDRTNNQVLTATNPSVGARNNITTIDTSDYVTQYWIEGLSMLSQPSSATAISIVSSSASDTTQTVRIWGIDSNGAEQTDSVLLTGTTPAVTTVTFTRVDRVSKDSDTAGIVTGSAGTTAVFKIDPYSYGSSYTNIRLASPTADAISLTLAYKITQPRLVNDQDTPIFDCCQALVIGGYIDALRQQRQHTKAKVMEYNANEPTDPTTYEGKVREMIKQFDQQQDNLPMFRPQVTRADIDYTWR